MIEVDTDLWIGDHEDAKAKDLGSIKSVLCVCSDMRVILHGDCVTFAQCGLVNGPGNSMAAYHATLLMLYSLVRSGPTLVVGHNGSMPAVVAIMYQHLVCRRGWDYWLDHITQAYRNQSDRVLMTCVGKVLVNFESWVLDVHEVHRAAFNRINWRLLTSVTEGA